MNIFEFSQNIIDICASKKYIEDVELLVFDEPVIKLRASISGNTFVEIFYNSETGKHSFALIKKEERIFGADNTKGWHLHPFENPNTHVPCNPMSFDSFIELMEEKIGLWRKQK